MYSYNETLQIVENFMQQSDLRKFCTDICKGACCGSCYRTNPNACHRTDGRRLGCSSYLCARLSDYFEEFFGYKKIEKLEKAHMHIGNTLTNIFFKKIMDRHSSIYFTPYPKDVIKIFKIAKYKIRPFMQSTMIKAVKKALKEMPLEIRDSLDYNINHGKERTPYEN